MAEESEEWSSEGAYLNQFGNPRDMTPRDPRRLNMRPVEIAEMVLAALDREQEREDEMERLRRDALFERYRLLNDSGGDILPVPVGNGTPTKVSTKTVLRRARERIGAPARLPPPPQVKLGPPTKPPQRIKRKLSSPKKVEKK